MASALTGSFPLRRRPRVAIVSSYFSLYDEQLPSDFRAARERATRSRAALLARQFDIIDVGMLSSEEDGARANVRLQGERPEAIVLAPAMVAPPSYALRALANVEAPVVIWNAPTIECLPPDLSQSAATAETTQVACVMLANALHRLGRSFEVVTTRPEDPDPIVRTVRAVATAAALRGLTALRVGGPVPGYLDVESSAAELAALGVREQPVTVSALNQAFAAAAPGAAGERDTSAGDPNLSYKSPASGADRRWQGCVDPRSAQLSRALDALVAEHGASCGTVNCHGPWLRQNSQIGICACFGVSLLTERGVPFSCTGDQPTALALLLARRLSGRALYCELYTPELASGLMLLASGGEGDPAWAQSGTPIVVAPNHHYPGINGAGTALAFRIAPEPATLLSLSPVRDGWRLAWAPGEVVESRYEHIGGPNAMFRFDSGPASRVASSWIASGATHHAALALGRLDLEVPIVARALGVEPVRV